MTIRDLMRGALLVVAALGASAPSAQAQPVLRASEEPAFVDKSRITIFLPLPYDLMKIPDPPPTGYFVWRITVETLQPFSVVVTSDTALRSAKPGDVLKASTARLCADPLGESAHDCRDPLAATIEVGTDHFRITIRDAELVGRVFRERPALYWRYVVEPGGRFRLTQHRFTHQVFRRP